MNDHFETIDAAVKATVASLTNKADALDEAWSELQGQIAAMEKECERLREERDECDCDQCDRVAELKVHTAQITQLRLDALKDRDQWRTRALRDAAALDVMTAERDALVSVVAERLRRVTQDVDIEGYSTSVEHVENHVDDRAYLAKRDAACDPLRGECDELLT